MGGGSDTDPMKADDGKGLGDGGPMSFEAALEAVERIVRRMERGDLSLDESIEAFESGMGYVELCSRKLGEAETKVIMVRERYGPQKADGGAAGG
ncbi:MAG: exodeoxyribonuclease VII small subunit [Oscillospiraceae bacterium]|nr:exodeoxyribonuclease VII small subunit [Oscillospiraceae bacterium]